MLKKEIKEDKRQWKDILCSQISKINTVKISVLSKLTCKLNTISIKIPMPYFIGLEKQYKTPSETTMAVDIQSNPKE